MGSPPHPVKPSLKGCFRSGVSDEVQQAGHVLRAWSWCGAEKSPPRHILLQPPLPAPLKPFTLGLELEALPRHPAIEGGPPYPTAWAPSAIVGRQVPQPGAPAPFPKSAFLLHPELLSFLLFPQNSPPATICWAGVQELPQPKPLP